MKVLITANAAWNVANFRGELAKSLQDDGHTVVAMAPPDKAVAALSKLGVRHVPIQIDPKGMAPLKDAKLIRDFKRTFRAEQPDVILSYTIKNNIYAGLPSSDTFAFALPKTAVKTGVTPKRAYQRQSRAMHILVTGGAGYIGSHACRALAEAGYRPVAYDNLSKGRRSAVQWGPFEEGDTLDGARLREVFETYEPAAVMHFAAAIEVGESVTDPAKYWRNNFSGSLTLAEAMRDAGCDKLVFSSTCAVYDGNTEADLTEESPIGPINAYGHSKRATEMMLADMGAAHGLRAIIFRYFNVAGAAKGAGIGQTHEGATHIIPRLLAALDGGKAEMTIYGDDYDTPDGTCIRDYIHVDDLVTAHVAGLRRLLAAGEGRIYNLGTGRGASVREVIEAAAKVVGHTPDIAVGPRRAGDAVRLISGSARAAEELGWVPKSSDLETILADAWAWHKAGGGA